MRIKIPIPPQEIKEANLGLKPHFESSITLRVSDMNYGNHMGNDTVLSLAHEFRVRFLAKYGFNELSFFGKGIIMSDSAIQYRAQGFWGQEVTANLWYIPRGSTRFDLYYQLKSKDDKGNFYDIAYIKTGQVFFDYETQKVSKPEDNYQEAYKEFISGFGLEKLP